jgi:cytoplasmic iron level regulating protein YaaA (DUF328/UPF0246 family)
MKTPKQPVKTLKEHKLEYEKEKVSILANLYRHLVSLEPVRTYGSSTAEIAIEKGLFPIWESGYEDAIKKWADNQGATYVGYLEQKPYTHYHLQFKI